jgi:hypothetical protein
MKIRIGIIYKQLSSTKEVSKLWLSDSHNLVKGVKEFVLVFSYSLTELDGIRYRKSQDNGTGQL